jgi:serine/threonine-protein kinase
MLRAGEVLGGDVRLDELIGEGASGWVFRGQQMQLGRTVAVKVLKVDDLTEPVAAWKRFQREARVLADLVHPGIVQVYTLDHHERWPYFVMEYLRGRSIAARLKAEEQLSVAAALHVVEMACDPLGAAHDRSIVHRDLKPANLFETDEGRVKVIDFGIARLFDADSGQRGRITSTGVLVGTPAFMAPEQARDMAIDARTDIYALGVILYQLLTGRLPYDENEHSSDLALLGRIAAGVELPTAVEEHRPDVPASVAALVAQCMSYSPENRYQTTEALGAAIREILVQLRPTAKSSDRTINAPPSVVASLLATPRRDPAAPSSRMPTLEAAENHVNMATPASIAPATSTAPGKLRTPAAVSKVMVTAPETPHAIGLAGAMLCTGATAGASPSAEPARRPMAAKAAPAHDGEPLTPPSAIDPRRVRARANSMPAIAVAAVAVAFMAAAAGWAITRRRPLAHAAVASQPVVAQPAQARPAPLIRTNHEPPAAATPKRGHVRVVTTPAGAAVVIDGRTVGRSPVDVLGPSDHLVRVHLELDGYTSRDEEVMPSVGGGEAIYTLAPISAATQPLRPARSNHRHHAVRSVTTPAPAEAPAEHRSLTDPSNLLQPSRDK